MAPNIPLKDTWGESEESSREMLVEVSEPPVVDVPEVFLPHLPQHFQDPDSPNLHLLQRTEPRRGTQKPTTRIPSTSTRSTLRALRPSSETTRPDEVFSEPSSVRVLGDAAQVTGVNVGGRNPRLRPQYNDKEVLQGTAVSSVVSALPPSSTLTPNNQQNSNNSQEPHNRQNPSFRQSPREGLTGSSFHFTKDPLFGTVGETRKVTLDQAPNTPSTYSTSSPATSTQRIDPGVLKLPGHEPEAPADLVLVHHERAIDTRNQTGLNGIFVRDDSTALTPEGATALILVGICTVFLVFICLLFFVQKIRRQRIERKVVQDSDVVKPQTTYEATSSMHHPNPLSLLPPGFLQALTSLTLSAAGRTDDHMSPSFLTMEPLQSSNSLGRLWFSVYYDYVETALVLRILHAR
ncbi:uncharacterized protein LOC121875712 [Homarus americanus]|uniref:uncharacterized protein LOC121875712 n=1 Tax=Homarus americanus TaxID=6706 RepID=UPI001C475231|nr:uncharacterized protein LOC121875712 [Homarus americanus]